MKRTVLAFTLSATLAHNLVFAADDAAVKNDVQLRAMWDELARAKTLQLNNLDQPYFVQYSIGDSDVVVITASLGGILSSSRSRSRSPRVEVRVGGYQFDNSNSVYSGIIRTGNLPVDDDYQALRTNFWLASDAAYKTAVEQITRKRNALREIADPDRTPDFSQAKPVVSLEPEPSLNIDLPKWEDILRRVSGRFANAPSVTQSTVRLRSISSSFRVVNSEGTVIRMPQELTDLTIRAEALAADGSKVWNHQTAATLQLSNLPNAKELEKMAESVAADLESLVKAPLAEDYSGPVLFEQEAAAQMMASALADAIRLQRKPVAPPGSNTGLLDGVWSTKLGAKVLPEWMSIVDDPSKREFKGNILAGAYKLDDEGVPAERVVIVENGVLKGYISSREPVKSVFASNGHGRLPGGFGSEQAVPGNLFVEAGKTVKEKDMKASLIEKVKTTGAKYGLLVRRLDFPSTAGGEELQSMGRQLQKGGYSRTLNSPLLAYRVYPDGREELVRGLRFKDFSAKDLRDISLASDRPYVFNYVNNGSSFNHAEGGSSATTTTVISPSLMLDSLDLSRAENEPGKLPIVPAPVLISQ